MLDVLGGPNHKGADECEGPDKCGFDAILLADTDKQVVYPQVFYYYMGHFRLVSLSIIGCICAIIIIAGYACVKIMVCLSPSTPPPLSLFLK